MRLKILILLILCGYLDCYSQFCGSDRTLIIPYGIRSVHIYSDTTKVCINKYGKYLHIDRGYDLSVYKFHTTRWIKHRCRDKGYPNSVNYFVSDKYLYIEYWIFNNNRNVLVYIEKYNLTNYANKKENNNKT